MSRSDNDKAKIGLLMVGVGGWLFYKSLQNMKLRRRISDTGTSRIASAALGDSVEINGQVISDSDSIESPLSRKKCVAFIWDIEREVGSGKNRRWELEHRFYSTPYFYVTDESREVAAVDLSSCSFQESMYEYQAPFDDHSMNIPGPAVDLLKQYKMLANRTFFSNKYRISEKIVMKGEKFFIHGAAALVPKSEMPQNTGGKNKFGRRHHKLIERVKLAFRSKQQDPDMIRKYDINQNGRLDEAESVKLYSDIENNILQLYGVKSGTSYLKRAKFLFCGSKNEGIIFPIDSVCISRKSEAELLSSLGGMSFMGFFAGPLLVVFGLSILFSDHH